jgi:hypothetical protein
LILGWMMAGLQVFSVSQEQPVQNPPTESPGDSSGSQRTAPAPALSGIAGMQTGGDTDDSSDDLPVIPSLLGGQGTSTLSALKRSNYLNGGVNVTGAYDDNPLLVSSGATGNPSVSIFPSLGISESSSRMRWSLGYAGGLTVNQSLPSENADSQSLNFESQFRLSPHVNLRVAEVFSLTTGFFDSGNGLGVGSTGPNPSLITPLATQRSSATTVESNYHFARNDLIGASGSYYDLDYTNTGAALGGQATQLTDTQTASGSVFWLHRILPRDWGGLSYRFDRITLGGGSEETRVHSFVAVNSLSLSKRFALTGFIGPQYSENQGLVTGVTSPTQSSGWSVTGGADGAWKGVRTGISGGYSRSISNGSGVLGVVRLQNLHANFSRILVPGWAVALYANRGTNQSIIVPFANTANAINVTSVGIALERNVGKSVGLRFGYTHDSQAQLGVPGPTLSSPTETLDANRNRVFVTLSYRWAKPLGM